MKLNNAVLPMKLVFSSQNSSQQNRGFSDFRSGSADSTLKYLQLSDLQSVQRSNSISLTKGSFNQSSSLSGTLKAQAQIKNNEIFVYKIIHDLRHPTEYLANNLATLGEELANEFLKSDANLQLVESKLFRYVGQKRIRRALKTLRGLENFSFSGS